MSKSMMTILLLFSSVSFASSLETDCFEKNIAEACNIQGQTISNGSVKNSSKERYRFYFQGCSLKSEQSCSQATFLAQELGGDFPKRIEKKIVELCSGEKVACDALVDLYEDEGKHTEALKVTHDYPEKIRPWNSYTIEFKYGNKATAYKRMTDACEKDSAECQAVFRYYPEHPQREKIIKGVEQHCQQTGNESGNTDCIDLGVYLFDGGDQKKGLRLIDASCKNGDTAACKVLIALEDTEEKKDQAFKRFCAALNQARIIGSAPINRFCSSEKIEFINKEIIESSQKSLKFYREQLHQPAKK
jgi:hypothetical protein